MDKTDKVQARVGEGLIHETKIPVQELSLKMEGDLYTRRGVSAGHYSNRIFMMLTPFNVP